MSVASIKQDGEFLGKPALVCLDFKKDLVAAIVSNCYTQLFCFFLDGFRQDADAVVDGFKEWA